MMIRPTSVAILATALLAGCASTSAESSFGDVRSTVEQRTGHRVRWNADTESDRKADRAVRELLRKPLEAEGAVQVALLRNPSLQAMYEELSIAQADLVQAGVLSNPVFSIGLTVAERDALDPNLLGGVTQSFLDLLLIPAKRKIAKSEIEQAKYRVGNAILSHAAEVKAAYFAVLGAEQTLGMRRTVAEAEQAAFELSMGQRDAGNISDLTFTSERALAQQMQLDVTRAEAELAVARERLTRLMGVWGADTAWRTPGRLPEVPEREPPLEHLESRAIAARLDLAAIRQEMQTLHYATNLASSSRWTGVVDIGADVGRLKNGDIAVGPRLSIELPLFDQRRGTIARLAAQLRASEHLLASRAIEVRSEVREALSRLLYARQVVARYHDEVIPTREQLVQLSQQQYDAMLLGVYQLVQAKQAEITSYREYIEAVRDYWTARSELERTLGGYLPVTPPGPSRP